MANLASGTWWLLNWQTDRAFCLGSRRDWTKHTGKMLRTQIIAGGGFAEVVDDSTTWGRILLGQPHWQPVGDDLPRIEYQSAAEKQLALNCIRTDERRRLVTLCEALLEIDRAVFGVLPEPKWSGDDATV